MYHKTHPEMYSFTEICILRVTPSVSSSCEHIYQLRRTQNLQRLWESSFLLSIQPLITTNMFSVTIYLQALDTSYNGITQAMGFCDLASFTSKNVSRAYPCYSTRQFLLPFNSRILAIPQIHHMCLSSHQWTDNCISPTFWLLWVI